MDTDKRFTCPPFIQSRDLSRAAHLGFTDRIDNEGMTQEAAESLFNDLEIGETLVDEDGDTWERIA